MPLGHRHIAAAVDELIDELPAQKKEELVQRLILHKQLQELPLDERLQGVSLEELEAYLKKRKGENGS